MFSDKSLLNSETLGDVWKLAHNKHIENIDKANLPNICNELNSLVTSVSVKANRRLSLRASSNLIGGAAKLYKHSLDKLFDDMIKMNEDLLYRRKRYRVDSSSPESSDPSVGSTVELPEEMRRSAAVGFVDSSFSPTKRIRTDPKVKKTPRITMSRSSSENVDVINSNEETTRYESSNDGNVNQTEHVAVTAKIGKNGNRDNYVEPPFSEEENPKNKSKEEGVQTSPELTNSHREKRDSDMGNRSGNKENRDANITSNDIFQGFDRNLPFGYILIHGNYNSRIPSHIIFTSINSDVNSLI